MVLTNAPTLVILNYSPGASLIIVVFDGSKKGWGGVVMQLDKDEKRHPARFESGIWNPTESGYDAGKREYRSLLKTLKKFRFWLYRVHFILETDANTL